MKLAALNAFSSFFHSITKKAQSKYFNLLPDVLMILPPLKDEGDNDNLQSAFLALTELAEACPRMFRRVFSDLVKFSIGIVQKTDLDDATRQQAMELMSTFADHAPAMCRKDPSFTTDMVTQCLSLMTDVGQDDDDAEEWNASEDVSMPSDDGMCLLLQLDGEDSDQNHIAAEQAMDRLANRLGGEAVLPATFTWLPGMMISSNWKERHSALMAISAISEGCRELMLNELDKVLELVIPTLRDTHPRVRWAGCNALGQMSTDFSPMMQEKYHQVLLPNIIPVLNSTEPRVQSHAAAALVNFCEEAEPIILEPYLDELLSNLLRLLQSPKRFVQEQALSTIATIADSAETAFGKYYDTLMPLLFNVLREEQSKEFRLLRAKAMECATLIALAVGKEKMGPQALELVQILGNIQQGITDADDPQASYLLHCWGRMCRVLDKDFVPYLPGVMPPLLEIASAKADVQLLDPDDQLTAVEDEGWELVPLRGKMIGIKTAALDEKNTAIELLTIYAQILEGLFEGYVIDIASRIAFPGLAFFFHDPVRVSSAKLVPQLLNSYKLAHGLEHENFKQLWLQCVEKVTEVLSAEPAIDTLAEMYGCFYESVDVVGKNSLSAAQMATFIEATTSALDDYQDRVKTRAQERQELLTAPTDEDDESDSLALALEDDEALLSNMNKSFHTLFKHMGTAFLPAWQTLLPYYNAAATSTDTTQRQWAICVFDDLLEFTGPDSWAYHTHIITPLVNGMQDPNPANRQAAVYGAGMAAQKGGPAWADFAAASLPLLFQATRVPNARSEEEVYATENACAAIAKVLHYNSSKVQNAQAVVAEWVGTLPVVSDEETAPYAYSFLAELIDQ